MEQCIKIQWCVDRAIGQSIDGGHLVGRSVDWSVRCLSVYVHIYRLPCYHGSRMVTWCLDTMFACAWVPWQHGTRPFRHEHPLTFQTIARENPRQTTSTTHTCKVRAHCSKLVRICEYESTNVFLFKTCQNVRTRRMLWTP